MPVMPRLGWRRAGLCGGNALYHLVCMQCSTTCLFTFFILFYFIFLYMFYYYIVFFALTLLVGRQEEHHSTCKKIQR